MHRKHLIDLLDSYFPDAQEEILCKEKMLYFVHSQENCFERSLAIGHMTASCWILDKEGERALLMHHAKLNMWVQLGGHADGHPNLLEVALKEAEEESGLSAIEPISPSLFDIDIHLIPENPREKAHYHYDVRFLLRASQSCAVQKNHESKQLLWITKDPRDLPTDNLTVVRMFHKWKRLLYPSCLKIWQLSGFKAPKIDSREEG